MEYSKWNNKFILNIIALLLTINFLHAQTNVSGVIATNTTWTKAASPYNIKGNILVNIGVSLTIDAGVEVRFDPGKYLKIEGEIKAIGQNNDSIIFTSNSSNKYKGSWDKIWLKGTTSSYQSNYDYTSGSIFQYCRFSYASEGIRLDDAKIQIKNSLFTNNNYGINFKKTLNSLIYQNTFSNNLAGTSTSAGVEDYGVGSFTYCNIIENTFENNQTSGFSFGGNRNNSNNHLIKKNIIKNNGGVGLDFSWGDVVTGFSNNIIEQNIIYKNGSTGIIICRDQNIIKKNLISNNGGDGIGISGTYIYSGLTIEKNIIVSNSNRGVDLSSNNNTIFRYNQVIKSGKKNLYAAIELPSGYIGAANNNISYNTISFSNFSDFNINYGPNTITNNNFYGIKDFYFMKVTNKSNFTINATNNYWASLPSSEIIKRVYDKNNDFELGQINYTSPSVLPNIDAPISMPINVTKSISGGNIVLTWSSNIESDIAGYKVYYGGFTGYSYTSSADAGNVLTYTLPAGVGIDEDIAVTAYDASKDGTDDQYDGNESWYSPANKVPDRVTITNIIPSERQIQLNWTAVNNANKYNIYKSTDSSSFTLHASTTSLNYTDQNINTLQQRYYYKVAAFDSLDLSFFNYGLEGTHSLIKGEKPINIPSITSVVAYTDSIKLVFTYNSNFEGINNFKIYRASENESRKLLTTLNSTVKTYTDNVINDKKYTYDVTITNSTDESDPSSNILASAFSVPLLSERFHNKFDFSATDTLKWGKNKVATKYQFQVDTVKTFTSTALIITNPTDTFYANTNLVKNKYLYWRVRSGDNNGYSRWSDYFTSQIADKKATIDSIYSYTDEIKLKINKGNYLGVDSIYIYRSSTNEARSIIKRLSTSDVYYTDVVENDKLYTYDIAVKNSNDISKTSQSKSGYAFSVPILSNKFNNKFDFSATDTLKWGKNKVATKYQFEIDTVKTFTSTALIITNPIDTFYANTNLVKNKYLYWRVRSGDNNGYSKWSDYFTSQIADKKATIDSIYSYTDEIKLKINKGNYLGVDSIYIYRSSTNEARSIIKRLSTSDVYYTDVVENDKLYTYDIAVKNSNDISKTSQSKSGYAFSVPILSNKFNNKFDFSATDTLKWGKNKVATKYQFQVDTVKTFTSTALILTNPTDTFYANTNLTKNKYLYWRVRSGDNNGYSKWSDYFTSQIADKTATIDSIYSYTGEIKIKINRGNYLDVDSIYVYRSSLTETKSVIKRLSKSTVYYTDIVENNKLYTYEIAVKNNNDVSKFSNSKIATAFSIPSIISPKLNQYDIKPSHFFQFTKIILASKYEVQYDTINTFNSTAYQSTLLNDTSFTLNNLMQNQNYFWRVKGGDVNGYSSWSEIHKFQTYVKKATLDTIIAGNKKNILKFTLPSNKNIYKIYILRDTTSNPTKIIDSSFNINGQYIDEKNLSLNVKYYYSVQLVNTDYIKSDLSDIKFGKPYNTKPKAVILNSKNFNDVGEYNTVRTTYSALGSIDSDGKISNYSWYVNDSLVNSADSILIYYYSQGTNNLKLIITDNDGDRDTSQTNITLKSFDKKFKGGILGGISALNENTIFTADSTYDPMTGSSIYKLDKNGNTVFSLIVSSKIYTTPSISSDSSVFITSATNLNGFNKAGVPLWPTIPLGGISQVTPTIDSVLSRIYVGVSNKNFFAVDYKTGKVFWSIFSDAPINASAVISGDRKLVFVTEAGTLYGFDIKSDSVLTVPKWKLSLGETISKAAAVDNENNFYFGTSSGNLLKIKLNANGVAEKIWSISLTDPIQSSPVIDSRGNIYIGTSKGKFHKINSSDGKIKWTFETTGSIKSTPAITDYGNIIFATTSGNVFALDSLKNIRWSHKESSSISSNILYIDNTTYAGTESGNLFAIYDNPNTNTVNTNLSKINTPFTNLSSLSNNKISLKNYFDINLIKQKKLSSFISTANKEKPIWGTFQGNYKRTGSSSLDCPTKPIMNIQGNRTMCQGDSIKLTSTSITNSVWFFNNIKSNISDSIIFAKQPGIYKRVSFNENGCNVYSSEFELFVNISPEKPTANALGNTIVCEGTNVQLSSTSASSNTWFRDGSNIIRGTNQGFMVDSTGKYYVKVTSSNGCTSNSEMVSVTVNPNPIIPVLTSTANQICSGDSVSISVDGSLAKQWLNGTNQINAATGKTYVAKSSGFYSVIVTDQNGCKNKSSALEVIIKPTTEKPTLIPSGNKTICAGSSITLNSTINAGNIWYKDSIMIPSENGASITVSEPGIYHVSSQRPGYCINTADTIKINVTKAIKPSITSTTSNTLCIGDSVVLTSSTNGNQWYKDGLILLGSNGSHYSAKASGNYTVISTVNGCQSDTASKLINFNSLPASPTINTNSSLTICSGEKIILSSNVTNADGYLWKLNGNTVTGITSSSISAETAGAYSLAIKVNGCFSAASETKNLIVNPIPTKPIISANGPLVFCAGGNVSLISNITIGNTWFRDGSNIIRETNQGFMPDSTGKYYVKVTSSNGCTSTSDMLSITINKNPSVPILTSSATQICSGDSTSISVEGNLSKQWYNGTNMINGATGKVYTAKSSGFYSLMVTDQNGCKNNSASVEVVVKPSTEKPTLIPSGSKSFCAGSSVTLNSTVNAGNIWYKDSLVLIGAAGPSFTATEPGIYHVTSQRAGYCLSAADTIKINVIKAVKPTLTTLGSGSMCIGDSIVLSALTNGNQWYKDGLILAGSNGPTFVVKNSGTYSAISNVNGCLSDTASRTFNFNVSPNSPTINVSGSTTICSGEKIVFTSSITNADDYLWKLNGNPITGMTASTLTAGIAGIYSLSIKVNGCFSAQSESKNVVVTPTPAAPVISANGPLIFCAGGNVLLSSNSLNGNQWLLNGVPIPGATFSNLTASTTGIYSALITNNGCSSIPSSSIATTLNPQSAPLKAEINTGAFTGTKICFRDSTLFVSKNQYDKYLWSTGDTTQSIMVKKTDTISLKGTYNGNPCYSALSEKVIAIKNLNKTPVISVSGNSLSSTNSNYYRWYQNNMLVNGVVGYNFINPPVGVYKVETSSDNYCWDSSEEYIVLLSNTTTFNTDSIDIKTYPNPSTNGQFTVDIYFSNPTSVLSKLTITDMQGVIIQQSQKVLFTGQRLKIPINMGILKGTYAVHIDLNGKIRTILVVLN